MMSASDKSDTSDDAAHADASCAEQECQSCASTACDTSASSADKSSSPPRDNATNLKGIEALNAALMLSASDDNDEVPAYDAGNTRPSLPQHCQPCAHTAFATSSSALLVRLHLRRPAARAMSNGVGQLGLGLHHRDSGK
eukprot:5416615-Pleurochrysis_carterae.AAC.2